MTPTPTDPREEKPKIVGYRSIAVWPRGEVNLGDPNNESDDNHGTEEQARTVCRLLEQNGFGGNGRIFPLSTRVEPIYSAPTESTNSKLAAEIAELKDKLTATLMYQSVARGVIERILAADAKCDPSLDVDLRAYAIITERDTLRAELEAARKERDERQADLKMFMEMHDTALAAKDAAEKKRDAAREVLRQIATLDCGCVPCTGQCRTGRAAEIELESRMELARAALTPAPTQEPPAGKLPIGTKIRFLKTLYSPPNEEHPYLVYAHKDETGEITGYNNFEGYFVRTDRWQTPFGASLGDEFDAIPPAGGVTISNDSSSVSKDAASLPGPKETPTIAPNAIPESIGPCDPAAVTISSPADVPSVGRGEEICAHCNHRMDLVCDPTGAHEYYRCFICDPVLPTEGSGA